MKQDQGEPQTTAAYAGSANALVMISQEGRSFIIAPAPGGRLFFRAEHERGSVTNNLDAATVRGVRDYLTQWLESMQ